MITIAEISHSLFGTYGRTRGLVGLDVLKSFGNGMKFVWNRQNREGAMCTPVRVMITHVHRHVENRNEMRLVNGRLNMSTCDVNKTKA